MIEDYGTLSEKELMEEILQEIEENAALNASELELKFEGGKLHVLGSLPNEDEFEYLIGILENHLDSGDFEVEIDLEDGQSKIIKAGAFPEKAEKEESKDLEDTLEEADDDEMDFVDEENFDEDKW